MKKILIILIIIFLIACSNQSNAWPTKDVLEFNKGNITSVIRNNDDYVILVSDVNFNDYLEYISALKVTTFYYYNAYSKEEELTMNNNSLWTGTNDNKYIKLIYSNSILNIEIYNSKPSDWE